MDYTKWEEKQISVNNILLDSHNPRIPPDLGPRDQRSLLAVLVEHDKVEELARNIARNGYFPTESLIVVRKNGNTIVIEGNRRLAALKLLIAPEAAPEDQKSKFRSLSNRIDISKIKKVKVVVAPNREAVAPILMSRHTSPQIEAWKPIMKAAFYYRLLQDGITIEDLSHEYNIAEPEIIRYLRMYKMYQIACSLALPDDVAKIVSNPREFSATTLERYYGYNIAREFLGISFGEGADIVGSIDKDEFKKGYKKVITDIATGKVDSRVLGNTQNAQKYIDSFSEQESPDLSKKGYFTADTLLETPHDATKITVRQGKAAKKPKPKPKGLIPNHISCDVYNQRINDVFNELKTLPVAKYPNATAVLFRSLLEMSLSHYLGGSGELNVMIEDERQKREKRNQTLESDWQPSLKRMLTHLTSQTCKIIQNPNLIKVLKKFTSEKEELLSHDSLNYFVHNQFYSPNEQSLRRFWGQLEGLFQIILVEPDTK